jgi:competence protein ComEA
MNRRVLILTLASWMLVAPLSVIAQTSQTDAAAPKAAAPAAVVNLNTASAAQLESLPGIGPKTALRIVEYREKNGSFKKIEELMNVKGIGEKSFLKLKSRITVATAKQ